VIHYVGNPGSTAQQNRDYYASRSSEVSSHFVIGLKGEIIQCIPLHEKSSASNHRNKDTISIEVCHPDESGKFTDETYDSLVKLTVWLCEVCGLDSSDIIRHYDITGKQCPLYFVTHENAWERFKKDVEISIAK
jgi:N-acetylmuramoyl-L-alanine amidase